MATAPASDALGIHAWDGKALVNVGEFPRVDPEKKKRRTVIDPKTKVHHIDIQPSDEINTEEITVLEDAGKLTLRAGKVVVTVNLPPIARGSTARPTVR